MAFYTAALSRRRQLLEEIGGGFVSMLPPGDDITFNGNVPTRYLSLSCLDFVQQR